MPNYIETKISYEHNEAGKAVKRSLRYLVDAATFAEAEERALAEALPYASGECAAAAARKSNVLEVFNRGAERYYKVKARFVAYDETTGRSRRSAAFFLVGSPDVDGALAAFRKGMRGTVSDFEVASVSETEITDILDHAV